MELVEKLRRRRSLVDDHGASFESTPNKHTADGISMATNCIHPSPSPHTLTPSSGMSSQRRDFEEVMRSRKSLTDQMAKTFESKPSQNSLGNSIFARTGLPPSPTRGRKSFQPPSMPPPPPPTPADVESSAKKDTPVDVESSVKKCGNKEQRKHDDSLRRNILVDFPEDSVGISASPRITLNDCRPSSSSLVVYPDQVVWVAALAASKPVNSPLFHIKGCRWPLCLQFRPKVFAKSDRCTYVLALRGWQPRECQLVVALFAGSDTMSQRKWVGPVIDSDFSIEIAADSAETPVTCGFHYRRICS